MKSGRGFLLRREAIGGGGGLSTRLVNKSY